jgi:hypothetical protein
VAIAAAYGHAPLFTCHSAGCPPAGEPPHLRVSGGGGQAGRCPGRRPAVRRQQQQQQQQRLHAGLLAACGGCWAVAAASTLACSVAAELPGARARAWSHAIFTVTHALCAPLPLPACSLPSLLLQVVL